MKRLKVIHLFLVTGFLGCAGGAADSQPAVQGPLQAIRYERNGGIAGTHDVVEITPGGLVVVQGKLMGNKKGQLSADEIKKLAAAFADWATLKAEYPTPPGTADAFVLKIRYGQKEVAASDANREVPAAFAAARDAIEKIAGGIENK